MDVKQLLARLEALEKFVGFSQAAPDHSVVGIAESTCVSHPRSWFYDQDGNCITDSTASEAEAAPRPPRRVLTFSDPAWLQTSSEQEFEYSCIHDFSFTDADCEVETEIEVNSRTCYTEVTPRS